MNKKAVACLKFDNSPSTAALPPITLNVTNNNKTKNSLNEEN